jgi:hypothetical protein
MPCAVEELLCLPDETTRAFAVQLVFHVAARYPIKETELATNVGLQRMREAVESDSRELLVCHPHTCLALLSRALLCEAQCADIDRCPRFHTGYGSSLRASVSVYLCLCVLLQLHVNMRDSASGRMTHFFPICRLKSYRFCQRWLQHFLDLAVLSG